MRRRPNAGGFLTRDTTTGRRVGLTLKLFSATAVVVALVLLATLALTSLRANRTADESLQRGLRATVEAARLFIAAENAKLASGAGTAAQVPTFVAAIESGDRSSVLDQANVYRSVLGADYALITDGSGVLRARTDEPDARPDTLGGPLIGQALEGRQLAGVVVRNDERLYLAVATPLTRPGTEVVVGMLLAAHQVTDTLAGAVQRATGSEVVFYLLTGEGWPVVVASTLPRSADLEAVVAGMMGAEPPADGGMRPLEVRLGRERLLGFATPLQTPGGSVLGGYLVLRSRDRELAPFRRLQRTLFAAALGGLLIAVAAAALIARQIGRPIKALVEVTRRVADGDYEAEVAVTSRDEIGELAIAFGRMLEELKAKQQLVEYLSAPRSSLTQKLYAAGGETASVAMAQRVQDSPGALQPGEVFAGRYEVKGVLGVGGMGIVYRAWDRELGEAVAIKMLLADAMQSEPAALERFKQEIRLARKITHRNVVRTHDLGEVSGAYYITMEYVEGQSLKRLIQTRGSLPVTVVLTIGKQLCRALEVAHEQGVIHRDIKPQNLIVEPSGTLKVMDFGIARLATRSEGLTQAGMAIGTPEYMAPEQLLGGEVDFRADIYAAGALLFECLTGRTPFVADTPITLVAKQLEELPPSPRSLNPEVPEALAAVVLRALDKDPGERPQSAVELHDALDAIGP